LKLRNRGKSRSYGDLAKTFIAKIKALGAVSQPGNPMAGQSDGRAIQKLLAPFRVHF